jgi:hypothetical protein
MCTAAARCLVSSGSSKRSKTNKVDASSLVTLARPCLLWCVCCRSDYKESERKKLAGLIQGIAADVNAKAGRQRMIVLDLQVRQVQVQQ